MFAALLYVRHVRVAAFAGVVAGESDRMSGNLADGGSAVVTILSKCLGDNEVTHYQKHQKGEDEEPRKPEKMPRILEDAHQDLSTTITLEGSANLFECDLEHFSHTSPYKSVSGACM
jgi:hypothetical protein